MLVSFRRLAAAVLAASLLATALSLPTPQPAAAASLSRLAGADRYATAAAISAASFAPGVPVAFIATGQNFPDALAAGPAAAKQGGPILLVRSNELPAPTVTELTRLHPGRIVIVGSSGVVSDALATQLATYTAGTVTRLPGPDRYATAAAISAASFTPGVGVAYIATGQNFPDALAVAAVAVRDGHPILLVKSGTIPTSVAAELRRLRPGRIVVVGSSGVVSDAVAAALNGYTSGGVSRLAGGTRYTTAIAISAASFAPGVPVVYLATGANFPDALAAAPVAGRSGGPVLLIRPGHVPPELRAELGRLNPGRIVAVGSDGVVSDAVLSIANAARSPLPACAYRDVATARGSYRDWSNSLLDTIYMLPGNYYPGDLVSTASAGLNGGYLTRSLIIPDLTAMARDARNAGAPLQVVSGFRSYATQVSTFNHWVSVDGYQRALETSARPGHSEHQLGTTFDFTNVGNPDPFGSADWAQTPTGAWMRDHAWQYGFVMSYPAGKQALTCYAYEPWHYRYVGRETAKLMHDSGLTPREWIWLAYGN